MNIEMKRMIDAAFLLVSLFFGIQDYKERSIDVGLCILTALLGLLSCVLLRREMVDIGKALIPGVFLFGIALLSGGCVGMGDAVFTLLMGLFMNTQTVLTIVAISWCICAGISLGMVTHAIVCGNNKEKVGIPFITVMAMVMLIVCFLRERQAVL